MKYVAAIFVCLMSSGGFASESSLTCPETITNAGQCAAYSETIILKKYGSWVKRQGTVLSIGPIGGKTVEFKDPPHGGWSYYAVRYYKQAGLLLVRTQYIEGNSYTVVNMEHGSQMEIKGFPVFNADSTQFVAVDLDLEANYNPNVLSVYARNRYSIWNLQYYIEPQGWGPEAPVWVSETKVIFSKRYAYGEKPTLANLIFEDGNWNLKIRNK
jgi:hypothetical protein